LLVRSSTISHHVGRLHLLPFKHSFHTSARSANCAPSGNGLGFPLSVVDEDDEWSGDDTASMADQLWLYEHEPHSKIKDSPITYWIIKRSIWPQLAEMAIDVYSTPCMSDEPERVFSTTGALLQPRRRTLKGDIVEQMICLQS